MEPLRSAKAPSLARNAYLRVYPVNAPYYAAAVQWVERHHKYIMWVFWTYWLSRRLSLAEFRSAVLEQTARSIRTYNAQRGKPAGGLQNQLRSAVRYVALSFRTMVGPDPTEHRIGAFGAHYGHPDHWAPPPTFTEPRVLPPDPLEEETDVEALAKRLLLGSRLNWRQQVIISLHVMGGWTLTDVAPLFGVTKERIRQLSEQALAVMRQAAAPRLPVPPMPARPPDAKARSVIVGQLRAAANPARVRKLHAKRKKHKAGAYDDGGGI